MKKLFSVILSICLIVSLASVSHAAETSSEVEYFADGSYLVTSVEEQAVMPLASTVKGQKTSTYYSASNVAQWYVRVTGTFTCGDGYAKCTGSSVSTKIYNTDSWEITHKSSTYYRNQASASVTVNQLRSNGSVVQTMYRTVTLTCSADGTFS